MLKKFVCSTIIGLCVTACYGQPMGGTGSVPYPPYQQSYQPGSVTQYVPAVPQTVPLIPPNSEAYRDGWKEIYTSTNTHEYRPLRPYEYEQGNGHHGYYPQQYQQYPQQQVYYPQYQQYQPYQQQWCAPQQQQYYCYPQQNGWRLPYFLGGPRW